MRIYLVGAGAIAREHAKAATRLTDVRVTLHVADARPEAATALAADFPGATPYASVADMLAVPAKDDDVVVVATPVFAHRDNVLAVIASGRHVLCEKPLALSVHQAREMLDAAHAAGRHLGCCSSRFLGTRLAAALRDRIVSGALGDVYQVTWRTRQRKSRTGIEYQPQTPWFVNKALSGGGVLMDWGPYDISLLAEILRPSRVDVRSAWLATPDAFAANRPATVDVEFHTAAAMVWHTAAGAVPVNYERASCTFGPENASFCIEGARGAATYEWLNFGSSNRLTFWSETEDGQAVEEVLEEPMGDLHERPIQAFVGAILGRPTPNEVLVADAEAVFNFNVIRAIIESADGGQAVSVDLNDIKSRIGS